MVKAIKVLILGLALCVMAGAFNIASAQQEMAPMNPDQADGKPYLRAILNDLLSTHDRIKAAEARVESAEHLVSQSWSGWTPTFDISVEGGREEIDKPGGGTNKGRNEERIQATQLLWDFGGVNSDIDSSKALLNEYKAVLEQTRQQLMIQGVEAYLGLIRARETLKYAIQSEESMKRLSGMEETLVKRGAGLSYKELQIKAQLAGATSYRVTVERSLQTARNRFKAVYGFPIAIDEIEKMVPVPMPASYMPASLDDAIVQAQAQNPMLLQLKFSKERLSHDVGVQEATLYPKFEFVLEGKRREQDQGASGVRTENKATFRLATPVFPACMNTRPLSPPRPICAKSASRPLMFAAQLRKMSAMHGLNL